VPSQEQIRWAQLRVGITVILASIALAVLIFLMTGTTGLFARKLTLYSYVDNAGGLRAGAPVRLQGVDIGNVEAIRVVSGHPGTPIQITLKVGTKNGINQFIRKESVVLLSTAGVLGETYVDIDSSGAKAQASAQIADQDTLPSREVPDITDVVRASQSTLQNINSLLLRADRIMTFVESGQGSVGKLVYDKELYDNLNGSIKQLNGMLDDLNNGKGSVGKLLKDEELYNKVNATMDKLNRTMDGIDKGEGTAGKLLKDPALYNNANQTIAKANQLMDSVNAGKGALGKFAKDEEFARKLDEVMTRLDTVMGGLAEGKGSAGKFLHDTAFYDDTDKLLVETRSLIKAIREDPKKYLTIHVKIF